MGDVRRGIACCTHLQRRPTELWQRILCVFLLSHVLAHCFCSAFVNNHIVEISHPSHSAEMHLLLFITSDFGFQKSLLCFIIQYLSISMRRFDCVR